MQSNAKHNSLSIRYGWHLHHVHWHYLYPWGFCCTGFGLLLSFNSGAKDKGVLVTDGQSKRHKQLACDPSKNISIYNMPQYSSKVCTDDIGDRVPTMADFLLAFSTTEGNYEIIYSLYEIRYFSCNLIFYERSRFNI